MAIGLTEKNNIYFSQTSGEKAGGANTGDKTGAAKTTGERRVISWPDRQEVYDYCDELDSAVDPDKFFDYYDNREWQTASGPVYDWKALFRSWDRKEYRRTPKNNYKVRFGSNPVTDESLAAFMAGSETLLQKLRREKNA